MSRGASQRAHSWTPTRLLGRLARLRAHRLHLHHHVHAVDHAPEHHVAAVQPRGLDGGDEELAAVGVRPRVGHRQNAFLRVLQLEVLICAHNTEYVKRRRHACGRSCSAREVGCRCARAAQLPRAGTRTGELGAVDGLAAGAVLVGEVAALQLRRASAASKPHAGATPAQTVALCVAEKRGRGAHHEVGDDAVEDGALAALGGGGTRQRASVPRTARNSAALARGRTSAAACRARPRPSRRCTARGSSLRSWAPSCRTGPW